MYPNKIVCSTVSSADRMVKPKVLQLHTTYANFESRLPARSVLLRKRGGSTNCSSSSQTSLTIQETHVLCIHIYNMYTSYIFECPAVSSSDRIVKPKFAQLHTWHDEIKGRTRQVCIKAREGELLATSNRSSNTHFTA